MKKLWMLLVMLIILSGCGTSIDKNSAANGINEKFLGEWAGDIEILQSKITINLKLDKNVGTISVPEQGLKNYPFESITYDGDNINIMINFQGSKMNIIGELKENRIDGTIVQNGETVAFKLIPFEEQPLL